MASGRSGVSSRRDQDRRPEVITVATSAFRRRSVQVSKSPFRQLSHLHLHQGARRVASCKPMPWYPSYTMHRSVLLYPENLNQTDSTDLPRESITARRCRSLTSSPSILRLFLCGHGTAGRLSIFTRRPPELTSRPPAGEITCPRNGVAALAATQTVPTRACAPAI